MLTFQSTHPRGVRPGLGQDPCPASLVSIHAPARGATFPLWGVGGILICFNPRTREGCDEEGRRRQCWHSRFQSTHPRGVRPGLGQDPCPASLVSIHAPARGATFPLWGVGGILICFNPRTREGCDEEGRRRQCWHSRFQSTHPRGVRPTQGAGVRRETWFQSTHPRGVRLSW